jgi:hypothetical protein
VRVGARDAAWGGVGGLRSVREFWSRRRVRGVRLFENENNQMNIPKTAHHHILASLQRGCPKPTHARCRCPSGPPRHKMLTSPGALSSCDTTEHTRRRTTDAIRHNLNRNRDTTRLGFNAVPPPALNPYRITSVQCERAVPAHTFLGQARTSRVELRVKAYGRSRVCLGAMRARADIARRREPDSPGAAHAKEQSCLTILVRPGAIVRNRT